LGAAFVIIYGSSQGWPLSTTHCQVGATIAIGLFDGTGSVNGREVGIIVCGWLATLLIVGLIAAILVGPAPEPIKGILELDGKKSKGYCENYINWKVQQSIGRGKEGYSITVPKNSTAKTAKGYCENYIHWKVQQDIGRNKPGFSIVVPK
ncbi:hypothetical protein M885DRAFT_614249, partial [Pelagophyceae sp. CCMP2097]